MLKFKRVYSFSNWPIVDLLDYNYQMQLLKVQPQKRDLKGLLGANYDKHIQCSLQLEYSSHLSQPTEFKVLSSEHPHFKLDDRFFATFDQLKQIREAETINQQKFVLKELEQNDQFTVDAMQSYKPRLTCDTLSKEQLLLINIPIDSTIDQIKQFVQEHTNEQVDVKIETCSLNLNAYAILTFLKPAEEFQQKLHLLRFKGILQECKSVENTGEEDPFNRTIVITNIDKTKNLQEVLHFVGQYGRVLNAVIPLEITNVDLPLYSDIIDTLTEPCKLEILNVQTGEIEIDFFPSFQQFETLYKNFPEYWDPKIEQTILEFQQQQDEKQDQFRLYRLLNQKTVKCLKVPEHLKDTYKKVWIPEINRETVEENMTYKLHAKNYQNRGYCVCTFSSKAMAQRALHTINQEGTMELAELSLTPLNTLNVQPEFNLHSNQEKYGGKFRIENLAYTKVRAMKSWENLELYQVDLIYNLKQLEKIRQVISKVRDEVIEALHKDDEDLAAVIEEKKNKVQQKVYSELNKDEGFKKFVENQSFAKTINQFQEGLPVQEDSTSGRKFDLDITNTQYNKFVGAIKERADEIKLKQTEYADKLVEKYQKLFLEDDYERKVEKNVTKSDDNLLSMMQTRLIESYKQNEEINDDIQNAKQVMYRNLLIENRIQHFEEDAQRAFIHLKDKSKILKRELSYQERTKVAEQKNRFSVLITNPAYLKKQAIQQHDRFLDQIKHLLLGEEFQHEQLIAIHPLNHKDQLKLSQALAKDNQGKEFLSQEIIEYVREFDIPEGQGDVIREQEKNRKHLLSQITKDQISRIKQFSKQSYTQKLIHLDKYGITTETFEVTDDNADLQQMVEDLNNFVAIGSEKYEQVVDNLTKKRYIVKNEKPFVKYDLDAFDIKKQGGFDALESEFIQILTSNGFSLEQANNMLQSLEIDGVVPNELLDLIDNLPQPKSGESVEDIYSNQGLTRKQYELCKSLDFRNNLEEIKENVNQQAYLKDISKKYSPLTNDTMVRDQEEGTLKIRDKKGKFIIPKQKRY